MQKIFVFLVFASAIHSCCCQSSTVLCWTSIPYYYYNYYGYSLINVVLGDPDVYLPILSQNVNASMDKYKLKQYYSNYGTTYQSIAYGSKNDLLAVSTNPSRSIAIFLNVTRTDFAIYYELQNLSISNNVAGLALASNFNLLYWLDATFRYIGVINLQNLYWRKIIDSDLEMPNSLVVYEEKRFLFWSDIGSKPKIEHSNLFGKERTVIVNSSLNQPANLVVDQQRNRLCWLDGNFHCSDFNGGNIEVYMLNAFENVFKTFVLYKDIVLFGTHSGLFVSYKFKNNSTLTNFSTFTLYNNLKTISGSIDSEEITPSISNPCENGDKLCDYICFPSKDKDHVCGCPFGYSLDSDGKSCNLANLKENHILVNDIAQKMFYQVDPISRNIEAVLNFEEFTKCAVLVVFFNGAYIYYLLEDNLQIMQYNISNRTKSLYYRSTTSITDLIADQRNGVLYFSDVNGNIYKLNSSRPNLVIDTYGGIIYKLYLSPNSKLLFYSDCSTNRIVEYNLENQETRSFAVGMCVYSMAIDLLAEKVYFNNNSSNIYASNIASSTSSQIIYTASQAITDLTMNDDYLYFVENVNSVTRLNKQTLRSSYVTRPIFRAASKILIVKNVQETKNTENSAATGSLVAGLTIAAIVPIVAAVVVTVKMLKGM